MEGKEHKVISQESTFNELKKLINSGDSVDLARLDRALQGGSITPAHHMLLVHQLVERGELIEDGLIGVTKNLDVLATTDALTGLLNRRILKPTLDKLLQELRPHEQKRKLSLKSVMVIYLDINKFKNFNDQYGHHAGDQVLVTLADVLRGVTRRQDLIFRLGGDEFLILLPFYEAPKSEPEDDPDEIFRKKRERLGEGIPVATGKSHVLVTVAMGHEIITRGTDITADELLERADEKMYKSKNGQVKLKTKNPDRPQPQLELDI